MANQGEKHMIFLPVGKHLQLLVHLQQQQCKTASSGRYLISQSNVELRILCKVLLATVHGIDGPADTCRLH